MPEKPDLAALLGSRICHDLISPLGAIGNGVELLMMAGGQSGPEISLIAESVMNANARIRYFRIAFGASGNGLDQRISRSEVATILDDMTCGSRLQIEWQSPPDLSRREVKLALLLILCLETAMPYGGRIEVERSETRWAITGTAAKLKLDTALWNLLADPGILPEIGPQHVHFLLALEEIMRQHRRLSTTLTDSEIRFSF